MLTDLPFTPWHMQAIDTQRPTYHHEGQIERRKTRDLQTTMPSTDLPSSTET